MPASWALLSKGSPVATQEHCYLNGALLTYVNIGNKKWINMNIKATKNLGWFNTILETLNDRFWLVQGLCVTLQRVNVSVLLCEPMRHLRDSVLTNEGSSIWQLLRSWPSLLFPVCPTVSCSSNTEQLCSVSAVQSVFSVRVLTIDISCQNGNKTFHWMLTFC